MSETKNRLLAAILAGVMMLGFTACGDDDSTPDDAPSGADVGS